MSFYHGRGSGLHRFRLVLASFLAHDRLPFASVLPESRIEQVFADEGASFAREAEGVYTPAVTLWAWLSQVLFKEEQRSCLAAVARVAVLMVALGRPACALNSGAYCRARAKVPEGVLRRLVKEVATEGEKAVPPKRLWHGRHVVLVDGTTVSMPDTPKNQEEYPQSRSQKPGLGFPIVRLVVLLSLATGMALSPYAGKETGEPSLLRELLDAIDPETILLADRYYCGYFLIALALLGRRDFVTRLHQLRKTDFRTAKRLGKGDYLVEWTRPPRADRMDAAAYAQIPASLSVRLVQVEVREPGFRVDSFWVATTLTDAIEYSREEIAMLYRRRWLAELDLRALKQTLGMDVLRGKSPAMVRKELWTGLLAYNLIRRAMLQAALTAGRAPRSLSFALALQTIAASFILLACQRHALRARLIAAQLASLTASTVGDRPNRVEPRAVKRRRDPIALLTKPRAEARADLLRAHPA